MKKFVIATLVGALALGGVSAGVHAMNDDDNRYSKFAAAKLDDDVSMTDAEKVKITGPQAKQLALNLYNGTIEDIELEKENGRLVYHIDYKNTNDDKDVYVDALTGKAWHDQDDDRDDRDDDDNVKSVVAKKNVSNGNAIANKVKITKEQAIRIALNKVSGKVVEIELDKDDNQYEYEVEIKTNDGREVKIDVSATTGNVLKVDWED
ncbi:PepSY domain-containing protein [Paenibacillus sp. 481]|uniref:PepSY domain-containing protein n=1 Tax=Paenibacillus sp. 481 TaxID=2835869 RepID=UPI001E2B9C10|nr:PepSY domain-containing protein [Paenibacillus sp. 481]UHA72198.1 PepSY domain-containing protein [Paenibacillus sp. 481]